MRTLTVNDLNPAILDVQYAVRGELAIRAEHYRVLLATKRDHGLPFDRVIFSNIGNPQQKGLDQSPLTWIRQLVAVSEYPALVEKTQGIFPADVIERSREILDEVGSIGAYSHSQGIPSIRKNVAAFIAERDGYPSNPDDIFLTTGASAGVSMLLSMLIREPNHTGVLIPIPQYPLYTAVLAQYSGVPVPYYLDESSGWSTNPRLVREAITKAQQEGIDVRVLVVINPGNPTGAILPEETQYELVRLCEEFGLVLFADEVYQANQHDAKRHPWTSFKKIVCSLNSQIPLVSFHSISKGVMGECGRRGGYFELVNISEEVRAQVYKMASVGLCSPVSGQIAVDALVRPPRPGMPSYELYKRETEALRQALATRTHTMVQKLNQLPGMHCEDAAGALYVYPRVTLPRKAIEAAKQAGKKPDTFYCLALLDASGICAVSGSGFGQEGDEANLRLTCLCSGVDEYIGKLERFHRDFIAKYSD